MRFILTISFVMIVSLFAFGQGNRLQHKAFNKHYTSESTSVEKVAQYYFGLQPIQQSPHKVHIRIYIEEHIIDLYSNDNQTYYGDLINYAIECKQTESRKKVRFPNKKEHKYHFERIALDSLAVAKVVDRIYTTGQDTIPADSSNQRIKREFICNPFVIQYNINGNYREQSFYCPTVVLDSIDFRQTVVNNYFYFRDTLHLDSLYYRSFTKKLPKGKEYNCSNGNLWTLKVLTDKQKEEERVSSDADSYLRTIADSIKQHLESYLVLLNRSMPDNACEAAFYLIFDKGGRFKQVTVLRSYLRPNLRYDGIKEVKDYNRAIRRCKKAIKKTFNESDLYFLNVDYDVYIPIELNKNKHFYITSIYQKRYESPYMNF